MSRVRAVSGAADQVFSSLSNGLIVYAIAVVTTVKNFGQISLLLTLFLVAVGVLRGALGTPLLLMAGRALPEIRREGSFAVTTALLVSPVVGCVLWAVAGPDIRLPAMLIILATPIVLVEDVLRYVAIAEGRPHVAALADGAWAAGSAALLVATWVPLRVATTAFLIGGWTALAFLALVGMLVGVRVGPRLKQYPAWISDGWQHRARYGTESSLGNILVFAVLLFSAVVLTPEATATLRGAWALLAPVAIAASAVPLVVTPDSRRRDATPQQVWSSLARITVVTSVASLILGGALYFLPLTVGELVLGRTFEATQAITPIIAIEFALAPWAFAITVFLRTFNRSADALRLMVCHVLVSLVTVLGGAVLFHTAAGVAAGMATANTLIVACGLSWFKPWATPDSPSECLQPVAADLSRAGRASGVTW